MLVTVWTKSACPQCDMTKKQLTKNGIVFDEMSLEQHPEMLEQFKALGLLSAPIVVTDIKKWSGFRLEKINSLARYLKANETD